MSPVATPAENPYAGQGPVMLDVGGDVGALLVRMPASLEGVEIEIRSRRPGSNQHPQPHPHPHDQGERHDHEDGHDSTASHDSTAGDEHDDGFHLTHVEVLARRSAGGVVHCAVFPSLAGGRYELYERLRGPVRLEATINGGQVTELFWPS